MVREKLDNIIDLIEKAGEALLELYKKQDLDIEMKADATPVTEADKLSNEFLRKGLKKLFPEIPIISEETDVPDYYIRKNWKLFWLVDPLDGTKEFIYKNGRFCINIALIENNLPVFGIINNICDKEIIWAFKEDACYIRKEGITTELATSESTGAKLPMVVSRFNITEAEFEYIDYLQAKGYSMELIPLGASVKHCEIAKGTVDIYPKFGRCYEWDSAAGQLIVETAGGMVVNPQTFDGIKYNKENMVNPPFIMFSKKIREQIEDGNDVFIHYDR